MTKYEIAILVCRALGIYCFISALSTMQILALGVSRLLQSLASPSGVGFNSAAGPFWTVVISSAPSALQILYGIALWLGAPIWARWMLRAPQANFDDPLIAAPSTTVALLDTLKSATLWFLGLIALVYGVPQLGSSTATAYILWQRAPAGRTTSYSIGAYWIPHLVWSLTQIALGVVLLLMARNSSRRLALPVNNSANATPETPTPS